MKWVRRITEGTSLQRQIGQIRPESRSDVLNKQKRIRKKSRFVFNITYPVFSKLKTILSEIHLLLTADR